MLSFLVACLNGPLPGIWNILNCLDSLVHNSNPVPTLHMHEFRKSMVAQYNSLTLVLHHPQYENDSL